MKRVLTAVLLLPLFILVVFLPNAWYFTALVAAASVLCAREYFQIARASGFEVLRPIGYLLTLGLVAAAVWPEELRQEWVLALGLFLVMVLSLRGGADLSKALGGMAVTLFGAFYVGFLLGYLVALKATGTEAGKDLIFLLTATAWAGDTAAYYVGRAFGKHPLAPGVSPKKTWEGALANVGGSLLAAGIASVTFIHKIQGLLGLHILALGLAISVVGQVGDLCESALKRGAGVKDSSGILPGHGGLLDRLDSVLFCAPLVYYYHEVFLK